jgi:hypothetical protein
MPGFPVAAITRVLAARRGQHDCTRCNERVRPILSLPWNSIHQLNCNCAQQPLLPIAHNQPAYATLLAIEKASFLSPPPAYPAGPSPPAYKAVDDSNIEAADDDDDAAAAAWKFHLNLIMDVLTNILLTLSMLPVIPLSMATILFNLTSDFTSFTEVLTDPYCILLSVVGIFVFGFIVLMSYYTLLDEGICSYRRALLLPSGLFILFVAFMAGTSVCVARRVDWTSEINWANVMPST